MNPAGPPNAANFKVEFFKRLFDYPTRNTPPPLGVDDYETYIKGLAQRDFAPNISGTADATVDKSQAVSAAITVRGGLDITSGGDTNLIVQKVSATPVDPGFAIGGSGRSFSIALPAGSLANVYGPIDVTVKAWTVQGLGCDTATFCQKTVRLTLTNNPPAVSTGPYRIVGTTEAPVNGALTASDPDGDNPALFVYTKASEPVRGRLAAFNADGTFTYVPPAGFRTPFTDTFQVTVADAGRATSAVTTVTIASSGRNSAPVPVAITTPVQLDEDTSATVTVDPAADSDTRDVLRYSAGACTILGGTLAKTPGSADTDRSFVYTPAANANGNERCTYTVNDGTVSVDSTIAFQINPVADKPVASSPLVITIDVTTAVPQKNEYIDLKSLVTDPDTPVGNLEYRIINFSDFETGAPTPPSTFGSFAPVTAPGDDVPGGTFTYTNRINVALDFVIRYQVSDPALPAPRFVQRRAHKLRSDPYCGNVQRQRAAYRGRA